MTTGPEPARRRLLRWRVSFPWDHRTMRHRSAASLLSLSLLLAATAPAPAAAQPAPALDLHQAMADPDWIGPPVERAWWSWDGATAYYMAKRGGSSVRDTFAQPVAGGAAAVVDGAARAGIDAADPVFDAGRARMAFLRSGDVFVRDLRSGALTQVTRTEAGEAQLQWGRDGSLTWRSGSDWFRWTAGGGVAQAASARAEDAPGTAPKADDLRERQLRYIETLRTERDRREEMRTQAEAWRSADATRAPAPAYLGKDVEIQGSALSPDGRWLFVATQAKGADAGQGGKMPKYVTESGYEEFEDVRTRVGRNDPAPQSFWLVSVADGRVRELKTDALPGITQDPLAALRRAAADDDIAAIVLRVDSPGGSVTGSETIWREVVRTRERGKPVVASMGAVAASGGYYVSMAADAIVANPGTITGSIGVLTGKLVARELKDRLGVGSDTVRTNANADAWSINAPFTDEQQAHVEAEADLFYRDFVQRVAEGRHLSVEAVEQVARGRVWTGADALERGLVDELGGLRTAIRRAKVLAGIDEDTRVEVENLPSSSLLDVLRPKPSSLPAAASLQEVFGALAIQSVLGIADRTQRSLTGVNVLWLGETRY